MAITYKSQGAGAETEVNGAQLACVCPAVIAANDILLAHLIWLDDVSQPTDPSGWTRLYTSSGLGAALGTGTPVGRSYVYGKLAVGTEDGTTVNFGTAGGTAGRFGRIYSFAGYVSGSIQGVIPTASFSDIPKEDDPGLPTVTTTIAGALAIALIAQDDNNALAAGGAQTGGTWAEGVAEFVSTTVGAQGGVCQIQTCTPTANPGTVTGGVLTTVTDESSTIGFEIRPSVVATGADGASVGTSTVSGVGQSFPTADASAAGTSTVSADGAGIISADGLATGTATAAADGQTLFAGVGAADGLSVVSGVGLSTAVADGASAGLGAVSGGGLSTALADGASAGLGEALGDGQSIPAADATSAGTAVVTGIGLSIFAGVGNAAGVAIVLGEPPSIGSDGIAAGASIVEGVGSLIAAAEGAAAGLSTISGGGGAIMPFTGSSAAIAEALALSSAIAGGRGRSGWDEYADLPAGAAPIEIYINIGL